MNSDDPHDPEQNELPPVPLDTSAESGPVPAEESASPAEIPAPNDLAEGDTPAEPGPAAAVPPRIVAETPVGGRLPPALPPTPSPVPREPEVPPPAPAPSEQQPEAALPAAPASAENAAPAPPASPAAPDEMAAPEEWEEDLSPELAAVLFGKKKETPTPPPAEPQPPASRPAPTAQTVLASPAAAGEPVALTDIADARRLPISAQGSTSPAPGDQPGGKARYVRVEEPLRGDKGQCVTETWDYRGPDLPALEGRPIRRVHIEETRYADGSWHWTFEREYADKGRDRREVRASTDRAYIERADEVIKKDPATGKRVRRREQAQMILAEPAHEDKRGFLSSLLGRDDEEHGAKTWRAADPKAASRARKHGGDAF